MKKPQLQKIIKEEISKILKEKYFPRVLNVLNKGIGSGKFAKKGFQKQRKIAEEDMYENVVNGKASYETDISLAMQHHYRSILKAVREKRLHDDMIAISKTKNAPLRYAGKGREREVVRNVNDQAKIEGVASEANLTGTSVNGQFDLDVDSSGRWSVEKFKGLMYHIERNANVIARQTRRGKGNFILCSSDVASALAMAGVLDYAPALSTNLSVDDTGNTFAGVLNGSFKVYIDPYYASASQRPTGVSAGEGYCTVGYRGSNPFDAGLFYCPYVPLQMVRAVGENTFQPKIGFKTRYGIVSNPFVGATPASGLAATSTNSYYRSFEVLNLL